ncbi:MAG: ABC transporter ATP-binding protein [Planctomycetota bacterium]|nr:ABC transporter ATP-binding protein [Planctomycetota bacterium]MDA1106548.1 ABC transporter ATP-binding protein [Planctomycetota bacterium]
MGEPLLVADAVHKTYRVGRVDVPVLCGTSLSIARGEWVAILGSSGSGKSTLMHVLGGIDRPDRDKGDIRFKGESLASWGHGRIDRYRSRDVGFVFQHYHLLPELSVLENAALPCTVGGAGGLSLSGSREVRDRCTRLLEACGVGHRMCHRPAELSGGERQRVALVRALAADPAVLLADEPTGNLDAANSAAILDLIAARHSEGLTIAMVTHDQTVAARADRMVHLVDGRVECRPVSRSSGTSVPSRSPAAPA